MCKVNLINVNTTLYMPCRGTRNQFTSKQKSFRWSEENTSDTLFYMRNQEYAGKPQNGN